MNRRTILTIIVAFALLTGIPVSVFLVQQRQELRKRAVPATTVAITPPALTKKKGDTFTVSVTVNTGDNTVSAAQLVVTFDSTKLKANAITAGSFLPIILVPGAISGSSASITVGSQTTTPQQGEGTLATVTFEALADSGTTGISFGSETRVAGIGEQGNVLIGKTPGNVTLQSGASPSPTPTPPSGGTPTPTPPPGSTPTPTPLDGGTPTPTPTGGSGSQLQVTDPSSGETVTTNEPTISGKAQAGSTITVVIYSDPVTGVVTTDANGNWTYTSGQPLADGSHQITITEQQLDGTTRTTTSTFYVQTGGVPVTGSVTTMVLLLAVALFTLGSGIALALRK